MSDITFPGVITLMPAAHWRIAEQNNDEVLLESLQGEAQHICQLQLRLMKVAAKSEEQRRQLILSALNEPQPEQVSDSIYWTREKTAARDEESLVQRWLVAVHQDNCGLALVILDLSLPLEAETLAEALYTETEQMLNQAC